MEFLLEDLKMRCEALRTTVARAKEMLEGAPQGTLRISRRGSKVQYYHITDPRDTCGKYIRKENVDLVKRLAVKAYSQKLLRRAMRELQALERYLKVVEEENPDDVYEEIGEIRQRMVEPILLSGKKMAEIWSKQAYDENPYHPNEKMYETRRGEKVRSKSEVLFANNYDEMDIPYLYEKPLQLKDGGCFYPDFTIFDIRRKRLVFHEHFGMMDDPEYRAKCFRKIDRYRKNGIFVGKNLIVTFEGEGTILNMREYREMLKELF